MTTSHRPVFWFYGRFSPAPAKPFHVPVGFDVADRFAINLMADAFWIGVLGGDGAEFDDLRDDAERVAEAFAGAFALKTGDGLRVFIEAHVEALDAATMASVVGVRRAGKFEKPDDDDEVVLMALTDVDFAFRTSRHWRAALRDAGLATADHSDDAFLYAARSLECSARAVRDRAGELTSGDWTRLAERMSIEPDVLRDLKEPLSNARHAVAHGDGDDPALHLARENRGALLETSRKLVRVALGASEAMAVHAGLWAPPPTDPRNRA